MSMITRNNQLYRLLLVLPMFLLWTSTSSEAQVGVSFGYVSLDQTSLQEDLYPNIETKINGYSLAVDYWFRLKQKRLEFLPTLFFTKYNDEFNTANGGIQLKSTIYPFDFQGDCNCPTFSKQNDLIKKGFFLRLWPGISSWESDGIVGETHHGVVLQDGPINNWLFEIGASAGLDIGISNLLTITPEFSYRHIFGGDWDFNYEDRNVSFSALSAISPSIRVGLRFDKRNYGFSPPRRKRR